MTRTLSAPVTVAFDYTRSTGPVVGRFLTGLRDGPGRGRSYVGRAGRRTSAGVRPGHPRAGDRLRRRGPTGTVTSWTWVPEPVNGQPLDRPFAFALVTLDGADTPLLHALDVASPDDVATGMRVQVRWAEERVGAITDIACFEPADGRAASGRERARDQRRATPSPASSPRSRSTTSTPPRPRSRRSTAASPRAG